MSHYLSNLLTQTTSRYNTLRRTLLSNEDDGDTEDDSHISRVLRAYYTEKGRPFPPWLPPDPNDRRAITPQPLPQGGQYFAANAQAAGGRSQYSGVQAQQQAGNRGSLSDLWDPAPAAQQNPGGGGPMQPQSLRAGGGGSNRRPGAATQPSSNTLAPPQARLLPSQRAGSYQNVQGQQSLARPSMEPSPPSSSGGGGTAQERLKARLWGAGRGGSSSSVTTLGSLGASDQSGGGGGGNPYDTGGGGSGGGRRYGRTG
ncbi:hypothetical protein LTR85_003698 [Meristemomyces frigidus]|nr:hypothetical protein LTR85_003698 [Meristemomyces frigidus]